MAVRENPTAYLYASARIRAMEQGLVGREQLRQWATLPSAAELTEALISHGVFETGTTDEEEGFAHFVKQGFDTVRGMMPDAAFLRVLQYPYDCHNIKTALKCTLRHLSPTSLFVELGTVPPSEVEQALREKKYALLPPHMGKAAEEALVQFERTRDPQAIDFTIDAACFLDMSEAAGGLAFAKRYVEQRADLANILTCMRLLRAGGSDAARAQLSRALVEGGTLSHAFFFEAFEEGEAKLFEKLAHTPYAALVSDAGEKTLTAATLEQRADDLLMRTCQQVKYTPFGAEIPFAYLVGLLYSVKNLRILYAAKRMGWDTDTAMEKVRESYV